MSFEDSKASGRQLPEILRLLLGLGIDYLRWVSLMPMIVVSVLDLRIRWQPS